MVFHGAEPRVTRTTHNNMHIGEAFKSEQSFSRQTTTRLTTWVLTRKGMENTMRERQKERETERDKEREIDRETETDREKETDRERQRDIENDRDRDGETYNR